MDFLPLVAEVGFPIAAAIAAGYFVFLTLKFILDSVTANVKNIDSIIKRLDDRVSKMNTDVEEINIKVSKALNVPTVKKDKNG